MNYFPTLCQNRKNFSFRTLISLCLIIVAFQSNAQTEDKIGDDPGNKQRSAVLELESTNKGFLMPRMNSAQMAAISNPAVGLQIFNTVDSCIYIYRGATGWYSTCSAGYTNAWSLIGNANIDPSKNFLGTTDGQPLILKTNNTERLRFDAAGAITQTGTGVVTFTGNTKATSGLDVTNAVLTANAGATITGPSAGGGTVNLNTVGANTTNIGTPVATTNINGANLYIPSLNNGNLANDAILAINRASGKVDSLNINGLVANSITTNNGITKTVVNGVVNISLGGTLVTPTTVTTDATNTLTLNGLTHGSTVTDSVVVASGLGVLKKVSVAEIGATSVTASNGLNKNAANDIQLGGALTKATTVTTDATNTLAFSGLQHGSGLDSVVVADAVTGVLKRATVADIAAAGFLADNGLTKTGNKVQLGGTLTKNTSIAQATFDVNYSGGNVGIGTAAHPNSTLQLSGSMSLSYQIVTSNITLGDNDHIVLGDASAAPAGITITLPTPTPALNGRVYTIGKYDESANLVYFSPAINVTKTTTVPSVNFPKKYRVICNGTSWVLYTE